MIRPLQVSGEFVYGLLLFGNTPGFVLAAESLWEPAWLSVGPPHPQGLSSAQAHCTLADIAFRVRKIWPVGAIPK